MVLLREQRDALRVTQKELDGQLLAFEEIQQKLEDALARRAQLEREVVAEQAHLEKEEVRVGEYQALDAAVLLEAKSAEAARERFKALEERVNRILERTTRIAEAEKEAPILTEGQSAARQVKDDAEAAEAAARAALEAARRRSSDVRSLQARATAARDLRDAVQAVDGITGRMADHRGKTTSLET